MAIKAVSQIIATQEEVVASNFFLRVEGQVTANPKGLSVGGRKAFIERMPILA
jgi:hypothetical protein